MITDLLTQLARAEVGPHTCNQYADATPGGAVRCANLGRYLEQMRVLRPPILLVGEAPGYLGARRTGIPFSSDRLLLAGIDPPGILGRQRGYQLASSDGRIPGEQTATLVWRTLQALGTWAVGWNAYPFHPHQPGNPHSNRLPRAAELAHGQAFLAAMLALFPDTRVIAMGNTAHQALTRLEVAHERVRHPAQGGARLFAAGMQRICA